MCRDSHEEDARDVPQGQQREGEVEGGHGNHAHESTPGQEKGTAALAGDGVAPATDDLGRWMACCNVRCDVLCDVHALCRCASSLTHMDSAQLMTDRNATISKVCTRLATLTRSWAVAKEREALTMSSRPLFMTVSATREAKARISARRGTVSIGRPQTSLAHIYTVLLLRRGAATLLTREP